MRLKFLFFPIILVVSLAIFIGYIWPEIANIKKINEDWIAKTAELQAISVKESAIEAIESKISANAEETSLVNNYLPVNKTEERIINGINYLAGDSNVSLVNISLSASKALVPAAAIAEPADITKQAIDPLMIGAPVLSEVPEASTLQTTSASISVAGEYEKIRIFLDSLQRMPILSTIKSVNITKSENATVEPGAIDSTLSAVIVADFGNMGTIKVSNQQLKKIGNDLDNEIIVTLNKYISQKSQLIENASDAKGKLNPFLAN